MEGNSICPPGEICQLRLGLTQAWEMDYKAFIFSEEHSYASVNLADSERYQHDRELRRPES